MNCTVKPKLDTPSSSLVNKEIGRESYGWHEDEICGSICILALGK